MQNHKPKLSRKPGQHSTRRAPWNPLPWIAAGVFLLSFAAMAAIWNNIQDMERKRLQEHAELTQSIGETAKTFLISRQYDYFYEVLRLIKKTAFIENIAVLLDGRLVFQAKALPAMEKNRLGLYSHSQEIRKTVEYQNHKAAELRVTFSQEEFRRPKAAILAAFALVVFLLSCLGWAGYALYGTHQKLLLAEKTKAHMIYSITHDARQDLSVIQGKISSLLPKLENGLKPANMAKDLRLTLESSDSIERYLNNLKDQQSLATGRVEIICEWVGLHEVIESAAEAFAEKMELRHMTIAFGPMEKDPEIYIDPQMAKRIFMNLIHNAMKYSPAGGNVTIWQEIRDPWLHTYVRDQGQGIPRQDWERIFHPYIQLDARREGMGLGLATARSLASLLAGRLEVAESAVGQGTTMCLALPLSNAGQGKPEKE